MSLIERAPSEQESLSALTRTESSLSGSSEPAGYGGLMLDDDSDVWSSSNGDMYSTRESVSSAVGVRGGPDMHPHRTNEGGFPPVGAISKQEILQQNRMRRHINQLREKKVKMEEEVEQCRESLVACRENLKYLHAQHTELQHRVAGLDRLVNTQQQGEETEGGREEGGVGGREEGGAGGRGSVVATGGLLRAHLVRVGTEIEREEEEEKGLVEKLQTSELQLSAAVMAYSEHQDREVELRGAERHTQTVKNLQALQRLQMQTRMRVNADCTKRSKERLMETTLKIHENETKEAIKRARQAQEEGRAFLHKTLEQRRERETEEGRREREDMEKRMRAVLSLKRNTEDNEGTIQALQVLRGERDQRERVLEKEQRKQAVLDGENPDEVLLRKKRAKEFSKKKAEFEENRKQNHLEIVAKLLDEQKLKKRTEILASKSHWKGRWPLDGARQSDEVRQNEHVRKRKNKFQQRNTVHSPLGGDGDNPLIGANQTGKEEGGGNLESSDEEVHVHVGLMRECDIASSDFDETLTKPEIDGLWSQEARESLQRSPEEVETNDGGRGRGKGRSKLEQKMLKDVMDNLKQSIVRTQVAAGHEFKGCPFMSKPDVAEFKDFIPGDQLKQKLILTNVTYTVNYCKLVGVSPHLRDFVTVNFNPPGAMSAGLTCHMTVTFEAKVASIRRVLSYIQLNEDLCGEIELLSQTGPFSIPIRCTTRKCIVRVAGQREGEESEEGREVDFGTVCVGEIVRRCVVLRNDGALSTDFTVTANTNELQTRKLATTVTSGPIVEDSTHTVTSVTSVMSVMSEVRGDWGAVGRVKDTNRPVSRSTSNLPQVEVGGQPHDDDMLDKLGKQDVKPASPTKSKPSSPDAIGKLTTSEKSGKPSMPDKKGKAVLDTQKQDELEQQDRDSSGVTVQEEAGSGGDILEGKECVTVKGITEEDVPVISVGKNQAGCLEGYSSCKVELTYSPLGAVSSSQLFTIHFSQPGVPPITVRTKGKGLDLPIYVERDTIDLNICTVDRLYQDSIEIHNRGTTALRVSFNFPPVMATHCEILPHHGLVQGGSSFSAQIKLLPLAGIFTDCVKYFDGPENDCLTIPVEIHAVDQVRSVPFGIRARVTQSDLQFSSTDIDFGSCTIHESVVSCLKITNMSILPQEFGFVHLPECVDIQPNDGFGTLLPRETISLDIIFSASKPKDYCCELSCLTEINRTFKISCKGKGVLPALKMSGNIVNFAATPLNNTTTARISISNPKLSRLSSPVIRGAILPQGPKAYEFLVPDRVPLEISPCVGTIGLDETVSIELSYTPSLPHSAIREEALKRATEAARQQARAVAAEAQKTDIEPTVMNEKKGRRGSSRAGSTLKTKPVASGRGSSCSRKSGSGSVVGGEGSGESSQGSAGVIGEGVGGDGGASSVTGEDEVKVEMPEEGSEVWQQVMASLLDRFQNWTDQFSIPCFVSSEAPKSELDPVPYRPEDTLYVAVTVPIVKPALRLVSNEGTSTINFAAVATGDSLSKLVTVKNISDGTIKLSCSPLDPHGPFDLRNALRPLSTNSSYTLILRFSPQHGGKYYEILKLFYSESCGMELRLVGEAVEPHVVLEPDTNRMELGHTYVGDTSVKKLQLKNTCSLGIHYRVKLQGRTNKEGKFRAVNYSGQQVFDCIPFQGRIEPDDTAEVDVLFTPDHQSSHFSDVLHIDINDSPAFTVAVSGYAWSSTMYVMGGDHRENGFTGGERDLEFESMAASLPLPDGQEELVEPVLILFQSGQSEGEGGGEGGGEMQRELEIGCIKTALVKKNTGDFSVEPIPSSNPHAKAFSFEPMKWSVEAGGTKTLTITFHPPKTGAAHTIEANTNITLKGDTTRVCRLLLRAIMCD